MASSIQSLKTPGRVSVVSVRDTINGRLRVRGRAVAGVGLGARGRFRVRVRARQGCRLSVPVDEGTAQGQASGKG